MKTFKEVYTEALALDQVNTNPGKYYCTVFLGRMQPPTKAHIDIINNAAKKYSQPVVVAVVKSSNANSPFSVKLIKQILDKSLGTKSMVLELKSGFIGDFISPLRDKGFEPGYLLAGSDRLKGYQAQVKRYEEQFNLDLTVLEIPRTDSDISATKVRQALKDDDINTFKKMTHKGTHKFFDKLKKEIK